MACIMEIFSLPPDLVLEKATRKKVFFGKLQALMKKYLKKIFQTLKINRGLLSILGVKNENLVQGHCHTCWALKTRTFSIF